MRGAHVPRQGQGAAEVALARPPREPGDGVLSAAELAPADDAVDDLVAVGARIESLLDAMRASPDPRAADRAEELVRLLTDLYGAGLERVMALAGEDSPDVVRRLAGDELVSSLLTLHGLHPEGLRARVEGALAAVRPMLAEHGGDVELLDVDDDVGAVLLRLLGSCDGCASSASTLQHAVETAIHAAAPEVGIIDVEEPTPEPVAPVPIALGQKPTFDSCPAEPVAP